MTSNLIEGIVHAKIIKDQVKEGIQLIKQKFKFKRVPGLATIIVGEDPSSLMYVNLKNKACEEVGIKSIIEKMPFDSTEADLISKIKYFNKKKSINGILLQLPPPAHIKAANVLHYINPSKDVDGLNPVNIGNLSIGSENFVPCTPKGIMYLLEKYNVKIQGSRAVIINHSNIIGKPLSMLLLNRNATVTVCNEYTTNLQSHTENADIIISATGVRRLIKKGMVKQGVVIIDAGCSRVNGRVSGDVDFRNVQKKASLITPVPGGVGPMTIAMLLQNTLQSFQNTIDQVIKKIKT